MGHHDPPDISDVGIQFRKGLSHGIAYHSGNLSLWVVGGPTINHVLRGIDGQVVPVEVVGGSLQIELAALEFITFDVESEFTGRLVKGQGHVVVNAVEFQTGGRAIILAQAIASDAGGDGFVANIIERQYGELVGRAYSLRNGNHI